MNIPEAKRYLGMQCAVTYRNRHGNQVTKNLRIYDVEFVPLYGAYLIGDLEDVCLDKVSTIDSLD